MEELVAPIIALSCFPSLLAGQLPIQMRAGGATWMDGRSFGGEFKHFYVEILIWMDTSTIRTSAQLVRFEAKEELSLSPQKVEKCLRTVENTMWSISRLRLL